MQCESVWTSYFAKTVLITIISPLTKVWRMLCIDKFFNPTIALVCPKRTKGLRWRESTQVDSVLLIFYASAALKKKHKNRTLHGSLTVTHPILRVFIIVPVLKNLL